MMKQLWKKATAGISALALLGWCPATPNLWQNAGIALTAEAVSGSAEEFLGTATEASGMTVYNTRSKYSFQMNGNTYYQGIVFDNSESTAQMTFDVSEVNTLSFTVGHTDNTSTGGAKAKFYLDGEEYDSFSLHWTMNLMEYELDLNGVDSLQIVLEHSGKGSYAFADVTVDGIAPERQSKTPEYDSAEDFLNHGFSSSNMHLGNTDSKNPDFYMNGRGYYQGLIFNDTNVNSYVSFNVENVNTLSFTIGHVDNASTYSEDAVIYLDDKEYDRISLNWNMNLIDYTLDVSSAKSLRIVIERSGGYQENSSYAFADVSVDDYAPVKTYKIAEHDTVESFLNGGYSYSRIWVADPESVSPEFYMNGRAYYQGLVFSDSNANSSVCYNVENIQSISFTIGHVDGKGDYGATVRFYLDNQEADSVGLSWTMPLQEYTLDVSKAKVLRIVVERSGGYQENSSYAFAEFSVDEKQPSTMHSVPQYADGYDFLKSNFEATSGIWIPNIEAKEPEFYMMEQGYYQGLVFTKANNSQTLSFNVENLDSVSFTIGHLDDSGNYGGTLIFYLDNKKYNEVSLASDMENTPYTIDVSNTNVLRIKLNRSGGYNENVAYALADVSIVPSASQSTPTPPEPEVLAGDCNGDGVLTVVDAITLQRFLLNDGTKLTSEKAADVCKDDIINIFDLVKLKYLLIQK